MIYTISNDMLTVSVSSLGAEMQSIVSNSREYLWQGDPACWEQHSPVLFPFVGRFTDGKYRYEEHCYPMTIHGFASASEFALANQTNTSVTLTLADTPHSRAIYPFCFSLDITYALKNDQIQITYQVINHGADIMYFAIGGHPGFNVPLEDCLSFEDYYLEFSQVHTPTRVGHTPACFLSGTDTDFPLEGGKRLPLTHSMFDDDAIVLKNVADEVTLKSDKSTHFIRISYPGLPYLGLWHAPKTTAPYLCIEPWSSLPSRQDIVEDFRFKSDMIRLAAGCKYLTSWSITLR